MLFGVLAALLMPSKARPPDIDASPITATMLRRGVSPCRVVATAMPRAADMELEACPAMKVS